MAKALNIIDGLARDCFDSGDVMILVELQLLPISNVVRTVHRPNIRDTFVAPLSKVSSGNGCGEATRRPCKVGQAGLALSINIQIVLAHVQPKD